MKIAATATHAPDANMIFKVMAKERFKEKAETLILIRKEFMDDSIKHFSASFLHIRICTTGKHLA